MILLRRIVASRWGMPAALIALALATFLAKPVVFVGGGSDDARYLAAARAWVAHGPVVGALHWDLRHPLVLPVAVATRLLGEGAAGLLAVPVAYALGLMAVGLFMLRRRFGEGAAALWGLLFATNPLIHELATRLYPDLGEAFFVAASLAACTLAADRTGARRTVLLLLAGVGAALGLLMRETSAWLAIGYAGAFLMGKPLRRADWMVVAAGAVPLLALEEAWLWAATGDPFYRLHVALHHVEVPSDHMAGKVFTGGVLMNPALASRWIVSGPVDVHWTVNPLLYLFLDPFYGGAFVLAALLGWAGWRTSLSVAERRWLTRAALAGAAAFAFATYVLMVSQRPRYYVLALLAAMAFAAVKAVRLWPVRRRLVTALLALEVAASLVIIGVRHPAGRGLPPPAARQ